MYMLLLGLHTEQTLLELYQASTYYQDTYLRIQPVVDKFRNSAQVKCVENGKKIIIRVHSGHRYAKLISMQSTYASIGEIFSLKSHWFNFSSSLPYHQISLFITLLKHSIFSSVKSERL